MWRSIKYFEDDELSVALKKEAWNSRQGFITTRWLLMSMGPFCISACAKGYYGRHCSYVCSLNCKTCRHTDGMCSCEAGWMGLNCTTGTCILTTRVLNKKSLWKSEFLWKNTSVRTALVKTFKVIFLVCTQHSETVIFNWMIFFSEITVKRQQYIKCDLQLYR